MTLPVLAELPAILLPLVTRSEQSFRTAVAALEDDHASPTGPRSAGRNSPASVPPAISLLNRAFVTL